MFGLPDVDEDDRSNVDMNSVLIGHLLWLYVMELSLRIPFSELSQSSPTFRIQLGCYTISTLNPWIEF